MVLHAVCPRLSAFLTTLTFGALGINQIVSTVFETNAKKNANNRNKEGSFCPRAISDASRIPKNTTEVRKEFCAEKKDLTSMAVPRKKNDICNRTQITQQGMYLHYGLN